MPNKTDKFIDIFLISFVTLYFEILLIRWIPSSVQVLAYFSNIILISSFLGLGIGCMLADAKYNLLNLFPFLLLNLIIIVMSFSNVMVKVDNISGEYLLGSYRGGGIDCLAIIAIIFIFNALTFLPLGQKLGLALRHFKPLTSYSINISGSIIGVAAFSFISYLCLKPVYWFLIGLSAVLWFYLRPKKQLLLQVLILMAILFIVSGINASSKWSPYYKIDIRPDTISKISGKPVVFYIGVNDTHHQYAFDLSKDALSEFPDLRHYKDIYDFPYSLIHPKDVLILGSGSGNDTAAALSAGVKDIYAVEIDPLIAGLGKDLHSRRPYRSEYVHLSVGDARSFIRKADKKFDLITFGYLDSHKVLSQFSSVRLDNFIYTKESFRQVKELLNPGGIVSLTYLVFEEWIGDKLYAALKKVFGDDLVVFRARTYRNNDTAIFLAGSGIRGIDIKDTDGFKRYNGFNENARFITDDWPYLYLKEKGVPAHYLIILISIMAIALLAIFYVRPISVYKFNTHFFFLGAGFMLLETLSITRFALLFGSTWVVNAAVIISILVMALLAILYAEKAQKINIRLVYSLLIASIFLNWLIRPDFYLSFNKLLATGLSSFVLSAPLFFAGVIFANSFKQASDVSAAFAYNLLGAIIGGFCEYASMAVGFRPLFIAAIIIYLLSYGQNYGKRYPEFKK